MKEEGGMNLKGKQNLWRHTCAINNQYQQQQKKGWHLFSIYYLKKKKQTNWAEPFKAVTYLLPTAIVFVINIITYNLQAANWG